jgi:hypothetical protein
MSNILVAITNSAVSFIPLPCQPLHYLKSELKNSYNKMKGKM